MPSRWCELGHYLSIKLSTTWPERWWPFGPPAVWQNTWNAVQGTSALPVNAAHVVV